MNRWRTLATGLMLKLAVTAIFIAARMRITSRADGRAITACGNPHGKLQAVPEATLEVPVTLLLLPIRAPLTDLIRDERVDVDVAFWFIEDARYVTALVRRHYASVPVRILVDQCPFKIMLLHGQNVVEFSKANYTPFSFVPNDS